VSPKTATLPVTEPAMWKKLISKVHEGLELEPSFFAASRERRVTRSPDGSPRSQPGGGVWTRPPGVPPRARFCFLSALAHEVRS
jgi:hypothetical protein